MGALIRVGRKELAVISLILRILDQYSSYFIPYLLVYE